MMRMTAGLFISLDGSSSVEPSEWHFPYVEMLVLLPPSGSVPHEISAAPYVPVAAASYPDDAESERAEDDVPCRSRTVTRAVSATEHRRPRDRPVPIR